MTADPAQAKEFYAAVFDWTYQEAPAEFGGYTNFFSDGHKVAGLVGQPDPNAHEMWSTYLSTDDIDASLASAADAGATVLMPATQVADLGSMAVLIDPAGAAFGLWQPAGHTGFQKYNEPNSVSWDELHTKDYQLSLAFYSKVFGWGLDPLSDTEDFRYSTGLIDGEVVAGVMDAHSYLPAEIPSHWTVYFSVADVDATCLKLVKLAGTVLEPAKDTPFGRIAEVTDPSGARFKLHQVVAG
ncbi:MAG: VOC family protein [Jatrophihabitantaceae bacterium]